jgi:hypothetical protein
LILTDVAFVVVHDKVADEPLVMLVGLMARVTVGVEVDCEFEVEPPPPPLPQPARAAMIILIATTLAVFMTAPSSFEVFMTVDLLPSHTIFLLESHGCSKLTISKLYLLIFQFCGLFISLLNLYTRPPGSISLKVLKAHHKVNAVGLRRRTCRSSMKMKAAG